MLHLLHENKLIAPIDAPPDNPFDSDIENDDDYDNMRPKYSRGYSTTCEIKTRNIRKTLIMCFSFNAIRKLKTNTMNLYALTQY